MNDLVKNIILWVVVAVILMSVFSNLTTTGKTQEISYSEFIKSIQTHQVTDVMLTGRVITGTLQGGTKFSTYSPETDNKAMIGDLLKGGVVIKAKPLEQSIWMQIFISSFPFLIIIAMFLRKKGTYKPCTQTYLHKFYIRTNQYSVRQNVIQIVN